MKKYIVILVCFGILMSLPNLTWADCGDIGGFTGFSVDGNTVTLYARNRPFVKFDVQGCSVEATSRVQIIKSYVCDGDEIMVDNFKCTILNIITSMD
jgi:hypothetical protein